MTNSHIDDTPTKGTAIWWARLGTRWAARLTAAFLLGTVLIIFIGEGLFGGGGPNLAKMDWTGRLMMLAVLLSTAGFALIWWRELAGGLLVVAATAAFCGLNYFSWGRLPGGAFPLFYIPGILAILSWGLSLPAFRQARRE